MSIYVEILIRSDIDKVWLLTQDPGLHERWDLRFTEIEYLERPDPAEPQQFVYKTRLGFGMRIEGKGESVGSKIDAGTRTSSLKFWSDDPKSLISTGSGYWQYKEVPGGVQFLTGYDYQTRFGAVGRLIDRLAFRPLIGWATAWSFDSLRLWLEREISPECTRRNTLVHGVARLALAVSWLYQGIVPKLLYPNAEIASLSGVALPMPAPAFVNLAGWIETAAGLALLVFWNARWLLHIQNAVLAILLAGAAVSMPANLLAPFGPVPLTIAMIALGGIALLAGKELPMARRCKRRKET